MSTSPDDEPECTFERPNDINDGDEFVACSAPFYDAVVGKIGIEVPVNFWGEDDAWQVTVPDCECGDPVHGKLYWRTLDDAMTGYLLSCHCHSGYARCFVDPEPVKPDFSRMNLPAGGHAGFVMARRDGKYVLLDGRESQGAGTAGIGLPQTIDEWVATAEGEGAFFTREGKSGSVFWKGADGRVTFLIKVYEADGTLWYNIEAGIAVVRKRDNAGVSAWLLREQSDILFPVRFRIVEKYDDEGGELVVAGARGPCDGITPAGMKDLLDTILRVARDAQTRLAEEFGAVPVHESSDGREEGPDGGQTH